MEAGSLACNKNLDAGRIAWLWTHPKAALYLSVLARSSQGSLRQSSRSMAEWIAARIHREGWSV
jgi:hypothetical protein